MKRISALLICLIVLSVSGTGVFAFSDTTDHWAENYIDTMAQSGFVSGYPDGRFLPDNTITRAEFASIAVRLFGFPQDAKAGEMYLDVKEDAWYAPFVVAAGLSFPETEDYFRPNDAILRYEAAASMLNIYGYFEADDTNKARQMADYNDFSDDSFVTSIVEGALDFGIMQGSDEGFKPYDSLTRAELCTIMARAVEIFGMPQQEYYNECVNTIKGFIELYYSFISGGQTEDVIPDIQPEVKPETQPDNDNNTENVSFEKRVLELVNEQRRAYGLSDLVWDKALSDVARMHSEDMAANGFFDHTNLKGESPFDRMNNYGISYRAAAENIAAGQQTPESVVESWMNSSGHRANILGSSYTRMGVGIAKGGSYGIYWTQCFAG